MSQATNDSKLTKTATKQADINDDTIHPPDLRYGFKYKIEVAKPMSTTMLTPNAPDLDSFPVKNAAEPARQATVIWRISRKK